jgi:hypothetical protein
MGWLAIAARYVSLFEDVVKDAAKLRRAASVGASADARGAASAGSTHRPAQN